MSRLRQDAAGRVYGIGGLMTVRDNQGRAIRPSKGGLIKRSAAFCCASSRPVGNVSGMATSRR
jgi:hypothetical protein